MDLRERDHVYDRGGRDPYRRPARIYHSPSPSPDRRYERRAPRFHDEPDSDDGRPYYRDEPHEPRFSRPPRRDPSPEFLSRPPRRDPSPEFLSRPPRRDPSPEFPSRPPRRDPSPDFFSRAPRRDPSPEFEPRRLRERELEREYVRPPSPPPPRRPAVLRRQSSLDTYDRPHGNDLRFLERKEEYPPPARREDVRASYGAVPVPRSRRPLEFDDESFRGRPHRDHDRLREREVVKVRGRDSAGSVTTRTRTSGSGSSTSRETSPSRGTSAKSEYPKRGKTKIPGRLISKRALIDLGYPFLDEGKTVVILKALGQDQIDQVLRVSEEYKKAELEVSAARSSAGAIEDRREEFHIPPPPARPAEEVEVVRDTLVRDASPSRTYTNPYPTTSHPTSYASDATATAAGPLVMRPRSRSRSGRELRAEIRALESQRDARRHHRRSGSVGGDLVRVEKSGDGQQVVVFDEKVERVDEGYRGPRIERDKRGRLSLSVPRRK